MISEFYTSRFLEFTVSRFSDDLFGEAVSYNPLVPVSTISDFSLNNIFHQLGNFNWLIRQVLIIFLFRLLHLKLSFTGFNHLKTAFTRLCWLPAPVMFRTYCTYSADSNIIARLKSSNIFQFSIIFSYLVLSFIR